MEPRFLALSAALVLAGCASVGRSPAPAPRAAVEDAAGAFGGVAAGTASFGAGEDGTEAAADGADDGWCLAAGYRFSPWFAISTGYTQFGELEGTGNTERVELDGLPLLFHGILPLGERVALVGSRGGQRGSRKVELREGGSPSADELGTSPAFGAAVQYALTRSNAIGLELRVMRYLEVGDAAAGGFDNDVTFATVGLTVGTPR